MGFDDVQDVLMPREARDARERPPWGTILPGYLLIAGD